MADVGVLNLQIQADASQASTSLDSLADALKRVKAAVGKGLSFGKIPSQLKSLREAIEGNWGGSEQFKTAMTNLKEGANIIARANVGEKLANDAKGINAWVNAYQKVISTLNAAQKSNTAANKVENTVNSATMSMPTSPSTFSSSMFGGRMDQHFYALKDPDSGYGKVVSDIKSQTSNVANAINESGAKIKEAVSSSTDAIKSGIPADAANGFNAINSALKSMDGNSIKSITELAAALQSIGQLNGVGGELTNIANGLNAISNSTKKAEALASAIRIDASALNRMKEVCQGLTLPSFDGLIQLAKSMKGNSDSSVFLKRLAEAINSLKGSSLAEVAAGFREISTAVSQMDPNAFANITAFATALKELKGLGGIGANIKNIATGLTAMASATQNAEALASAIRIDASAINRMKTVCDGFKLPSFNNLIKLAESMQANPAASVYMKRIADSIEAIKAAGNGFTAPNMGAISNAAVPAATTAAPESSAVSGIQQVGDAVDEAAGKMQNLKPVTQEVMSSVADDAQNAASSIAHGMSKILPDSMTWRVGENMEPAIGQMKTDVDGVKESVAGMAQSAEADMQRVSDAVENTIGSYRRLENVGTKEDKVLEYQPRSQDSVNAARNAARAIEADNQARREAVLSSENSERLQAFAEQLFGPRVAANQAAQAMQTVGSAIQSTVNEAQSLQTVGNAAQTTAQSMQNVANATQTMNQSMQNVANAAQTATQGVQTLAQQNQQLQNSMNQTGSSQPYSSILNGIDSVVNSMSSAQAQTVTSALEMQARIHDLEAEENNMRNALAQDIQMGLDDANVIAQRAAQIRLLQTEQANLYNQLVQMEHAQKTSTRALRAIGNAFNTLREGMGRLPFAGLIKQMMRMAKMRALRYMIRELAKGFREGVENVYHYSEAIGGSFHESMDSAATALNQMKNSIGAAVAPALQALIPLFNTIVGWITTAANYLNQFFSLLNGRSTWTRALPVATKAFDEQKKAAKGASDSVKDMLADFDELNIIQQNGNGGGSGNNNAATDYTEMFEEVNEFDGKIKDMVGWIEEHMETVKGIAIAIGVAILGWKMSKAFDGALGSLGTIIAGGAMVAIGLQVTYSGAYAAGASDELTGESLLAMAGGALTSTIGGALIGFKIGGPWGALIGGAAGLVLSLVTIVKGIADGTAEFINKARWGNVEFTAEEMQAALDELFTFHVNVNVDLMKANVQGLIKTKLELFALTGSLAASVAKVRADISVGIDPTQDLSEAYDNAQTLLSTAQDYLNKVENSLSLTIQNVQFMDEQGVILNDDMLANLKLANTELRKAFEDLGRELARAYYEGQQNEWKNGEMENMLQLMESEQKILNGGKLQMLELRAQNGKNSILDMPWSELTRSNAEEWAEAASERIKNYKEQYADPIRQQLEEERDSYYNLAGIASAAITEYKAHDASYFGLSQDEYEARIKGFEDSVKKYTELGDTYTDKFIENEVNRLTGLGEIYDYFQEKWFSTLITTNPEANVNFKNWYIDDWDDMYDKYYSEYGLGSAKGAKDFIQAKMYNSFDEKQHALLDTLLESNQLNIFDILDTDNLGNIVRKFYDKWAEVNGADYAKEQVEKLVMGMFDNDVTKAASAIWHIWENDASKEWAEEFRRNNDPEGMKIAQKEIEEKYQSLLEAYNNGEADIYAFADFINSAIGNTQGKYGTDFAKEILSQWFTPTFINQAWLNDTPQAWQRSVERDETDNPAMLYINIPIGTTLEDILLATQSGTSGFTFDPTKFRGAGIPGPWGPAPKRSMPAVNTEGPGFEDNNTDTRTANATEATQQNLQTQNDKIDRLNVMLSAVLARLNAGLKVNMAPTSFAGQTMNGALQALAQITGDN